LKQTKGEIIRHNFFPSEYVEARNVDVWLPEDFSTDNEYAVLYMHDGQMLFDRTTTWNGQEWGVDETIHRLLSGKKIRNTIVVGIWNNDQLRHIEYFPEKPFGLLSENEQDSVFEELKSRGIEPPERNEFLSDNYLRFIVEELKPFVDSLYPTKQDRQNTFVAGSSMGGLISVYAISEYPEVFGGAACLSTHWPGIFSTENNPIPEVFANYLEKNLPSPAGHKIYFDHGTETLDAMYTLLQKKIDQVMISRGYQASNWITKVFPGANHSETAWQKRLHIPLEFLLSHEE
jgi:enterochelin esterase-like enzyme